MVSFSGKVRNHDGGMAVSRLSYAAHRVGLLEVRDPALVCAVSAAHRGQAFDVSSRLVDRIKAHVPMWKEQFFA